MKQKLITRLVLGAIATFAATGAFAGQIQASSVSIAREVITADAQPVVSPSIAYRFAGDVDGRVQAQTFQIQFILTSGKWPVTALGASNLPAGFETTISLTDGVSGAVLSQTNAAGVGDYTVNATGVTSDGKTLWATITVNNVATHGTGAAGVAVQLVKQPLVSVNVTLNRLANEAAIPALNDNVSAARATITNLYTDVVGSTVHTSGNCTPTPTAAVSFQHFVALTSPTSAATAANATADEHTRAGGTNTATIMAFPTNLKPTFTSTYANSAILAPGGTAFQDGIAAALPGTAIDAWVGLAQTINLGRVKIVQNASGYDSNLTNQYLLATGVNNPATAAVVNGVIEVSTLSVNVTADQGWAVGGALQLNSAATCAALTMLGAPSAITAANAGAGSTITTSATSANVVAGAALQEYFVCYTTPAAVTIPTSAFSGVATLNKAPTAGAGTYNHEQANACYGTLYSLGGGLKIDVRNYASSLEDSGYQSVLRFINNSDSSTADVWAQIIHQDGKLGNYGKLTDLAPRAVLNMTAAQIEAKLTSAPAAVVAANNGPAAPVAQAATATSAETAPRLRITSVNGKSLRVQNYLYNSATGQLLEGSNSQAVDFEGANAIRAPINDGQYISQDANSGINLK